ncbi:MAG: GGDEF domain-containing protein, partial [Nitrospiria bacterium]
MPKRKDAKQDSERRRDHHEGVDLAEALNLLRQAGYPDPTTDGIGGGQLLQRVIDTLCELSMQDGLTGLANARYFRIALEREVQRAARTGETCALLMLDLDHFKTINDQQGHLAGNTVLQTVSRRLLENLRPMDTVARFGGEEFAVILPNSSSADAINVAERLRARIAGEEILITEKIILQVTVSIGVSCTTPWSQTAPGTLVELADRNLYYAKTNGRNRVCHEVPPSAVSGDEKA